MLGTSCDLFNEEERTGVVARVNDSYLYEDDIKAIITESTSKEDSSVMATNYINRWATRELLVDRARINLSARQQEELNELVEIYEDELYSKAYIDAIIGRELDTLISKDTAEAYYEQKGENFILNEDLVKLRYISLSPGNSNLDEIKERLKRFDEEDKEELLDMALQFKAYSLNDTVWVKTRNVYNRIPPLTPESEAGFLKKPNFLELVDSLGVYLVAVEDVKFRNEQAPLEYSLPTIKQILLNKRKLELIKRLEKDITQDAIKNEEFEIYN